MTDSGKAANVVEALSRVMADLPAIGRDQTASQQQGGYAYRGIEQITKHTQGLFAEHGIVFVPRVVSYEIRDLMVNNKPWTDTVELVEYTVYGPGGVDDHITVGPILAVGRDNSDKGGNKCLTQAFKYALLQTLCISDAKDDGDNQSHEADARQQETLLPAGWNDRAEQRATFERLSSEVESLKDGIHEDLRVEIVAWVTKNRITPDTLTLAEAGTIEGMLPLVGANQGTVEDDPAPIQPTLDGATA